MQKRINELMVSRTERLLESNVKVGIVADNSEEFHYPVDSLVLSFYSNVHFVLLFVQVDQYFV